MAKDSETAPYFYQPRGWLNRANLNLNGVLGGLNFLASAYVTSEETPGRQPVDRLRLEIFDDTFNATLGDMYPVFSTYSLNNLFVRGGSWRTIMPQLSYLMLFFAVAIAIAGFSLRGSRRQ